MRQCIFPSCKSRPDDRVGNVALVHRFPQEEHFRKQWVQWVREKCGMPTFEFTPKAGLCYRHFDRHCYHRSNGLLKPFSYPAFTPSDLDNISQFGASAKDLFMNGTPKTSLIIKVDPFLFKHSPAEKTGPRKKFVLMVTGKRMPINQPSNSTVSVINQNEAGVCVIRPQDIPPLRFVGREKPAGAIDRISSNQNKSISIITNSGCVVQPQFRAVVSCPSPESNLYKNQDEVYECQDSVSSPCGVEQQSISERETDFSKTSCKTSASRSPRTVTLIQTVLNSSRRRIRVYQRRLQHEKKKMSKIEELLEEMKKEQLISVAVAEKFEAILSDE